MIQVEISAGIGPFRYHREYAFLFGPGMIIKIDVKLGPLDPNLTATTVYGGWHANLELGLKRANNVDNADHVHGGAAARGHGIAADDGHGVAAGGVDRHGVVAVDGHGVAAVDGHGVAAVDEHGVAAVDRMELLLWTAWNCCCGQAWSCCCGRAWSCRRERDVVIWLAL